MSLLIPLDVIFHAEKKKDDFPTSQHNRASIVMKIDILTYLLAPNAMVGLPAKDYLT